MLVLASVVLLVWVLLFAQELLNLASLRSLDGSSNPSQRPLVSILVPARNEAEAIEWSVRSFLAQDYEPLEVIVIDDRSTDATGAIVEKIAERDRRLVMVRGEELPPGWLGKPWALHQGSRVARGEMLLFVDADVLYAPQTVGAAVAFLLQRHFGALSLFPRLVMNGLWENLLMPWLSMAGLVLLPVWLANRSSSPLLALGGGPGVLLGRDSYQAMGGHEVLRNAIVDDIGLVRLARRHGIRTGIARADDLVSVRMYRGLREIIDGFTKNSAFVMGNRMDVTLLTLAGGLVLHFLPVVLGAIAVAQWLMGKPIQAAAALGLIAFGVITLIRLVFFMAFRYRIDMALWGHPVMAAVFLYILARSAWTVTLRKELSWRGRTYSADWVTFGGEKTESRKS